MGRLDVFKMVVLSFKNIAIAGAYLAAMIIVALHLTHGIQSFVQTIGLNNDKTILVVEKAGTVVAFLLLLGYAAIPIAIILGMLNFTG